MMDTFFFLLQYNSQDSQFSRLCIFSKYSWTKMYKQVQPGAFHWVLIFEMYCIIIIVIACTILMMIIRCEVDPESRSINHLCVIECWATRLVVQRDTPVIILTSLFSWWWQFFSGPASKLKKILMMSMMILAVFVMYINYCICVSL